MKNLPPGGDQRLENWGTAPPRKCTVKAKHPTLPTGPVRPVRPAFAIEPERAQKEM